MLRICITLLAIVGLISATSAQSLKFEAKVGPDGKVTLIPAEGNPNSEQLKPNVQMGEFADTVARNLYLWSGPDGLLKGIYASKDDAMAQQLAPGDTIEVRPASLGQGPSPEYLRQVAQEAARQLMQAAKDSACAFDPKPETISPTVEISFSVFAGASLSISATWRVADLCPTAP